jgi:hypothetical protein
MYFCENALLAIKSRRENCGLPRNSWECWHMGLSGSDDRGAAQEVDMFFLTKKQRVPLQSFCQSFYENSILSPTLGDKKIDVLSTFAQTHKRLIVDADSRFADIDTQKLVTETKILRFELFGLAWLHMFGPDLAVKRSLFTHDYLKMKNRSDLWDGMEIYNQQIFRSTLTLKKTMGATWVRYITKCNRTRFDSFTKYLDEAKRGGIDVEANEYSTCIARGLNHLFTEKVWKNRATAYQLIIPLCDRLGLDSEFLPNEQARLCLAAIIAGFYDGARQAMDNIKPVP